jgi:7-cyano-7-deazaguanine reductase
MGLASDDSIAIGADTWNCYELTWLGSNGYPKEATLQITYPASSPNLVESKSLKLYLMSFGMTRFNSLEDLIATVKNDLAGVLEISKDEIIARTIPHSELQAIRLPRGKNIDLLAPPIDKFEPNRSLLSHAKTRSIANDIYHSNTLRSLCPLTGQPDFGTVEIFYSGQALCEESLARYVVSLRNHGGYHEHCCEMIFADITAALNPSDLAVRCTYTRRGGIDISPVRYSDSAKDKLPYRRLPRS